MKLLSVDSNGKVRFLVDQEALNRNLDITSLGK